MGAEDIEHVAVLDPVNDEMTEALKAIRRSTIRWWTASKPIGLEPPSPN
jgi:hypothetical protein